MRFHSLERLKRALSALPKGEQVKVETGEFEYSKSIETKSSLVTAAIANARAFADQMAAGVGMRVAGVQSVSNQRLDVGVAYSDATAVAGLVSGGGADVVLKEGTIELAQDIYIVYLIAK